MKQKVNRKHIRSLRSRILIRLAVELLAFSALYLGALYLFSGPLFGFTYAVLRVFTGSWYYEFIALRDFFILAFYIAGVFIIIWLSIRRAVRDMEALAAACDSMMRDDDTLIHLPADLQSIEASLNEIKLSASRSRRLASEAEQRKNDLVVYLAHDLKTPLTSVVGYLTLLSEAPDMPAEQRAKYVGIALNKAYRLEELLDEFFDITRFNLHTIVLYKEQIDLSYMLLQLADEFYPMLAPNGKTAVVTAPEKLFIYADPDKLARVFNNVLKNAVIYGQEGSAIHIDAAESNNTVTVKISNTGNPIPPEKLEYIFQKFYRLDAGRSSGTGGAGLGLAIAREIITAHGGTITAESGDFSTTFILTLPANIAIVPPSGGHAAVEAPLAGIPYGGSEHTSADASLPPYPVQNSPGKPSADAYSLPYYGAPPPAVEGESFSKNTSFAEAKKSPAESTPSIPKEE